MKYPQILIAPAMACTALSLGACAHNYAVEGAAGGAAIGAGIAAVTGGNVGAGAAIGAAAGGVGGALIRKNGNCYRRNRSGEEYQVRCPD
jgi:hypothetical protein